jgi:hypothetical protein
MACVTFDILDIGIQSTSNRNATSCVISISCVVLYCPLLSRFSCTLIKLKPIIL